MRSQICSWCLPSCVLLACQGETVTPTGARDPIGGISAAAADVVATMRVVPDSQMVFVGDQYQVLAQPKNSAGQVLERTITWKISNTAIVTMVGTVGRTITLKAIKIGNTSVKATADGKSRFSKVIVRAVAGAKVVVTPSETSVDAGGTAQFVATGLTKAGETAGVNVTWTSETGTVSPAGLLTAGTNAGIYRMIARSAFGAADTSLVTVGSGPEPPAPAEITAVTLQPDVAASRGGEVTQFTASVLNSLGDSVPEARTYGATCGTITQAGVYTAPSPPSGSCLVTASAGEKADTTEVLLLSSDPALGTPYGIYELWSSTTQAKSNTAPFTASQSYIAPGSMVTQITTARAKGIRLSLAMTSGNHDRYKTDGVFDLAKWQAAMDAFNTPAIRDAIGQGVADGTIIGNVVLDEPQQHGNSDDPTKTWGPPGTLTKPRLDGMCAYVKAMFPTLPVGVGHDPLVFEPNNSYQVCEFFIDQYAARKGNVQTWRDAALAIANRDGMSIIFSLNLLDGGIQHTHPCPIPETGGDGTNGIKNCRMSPQQIRDWGKLLAPSGCAMMSWRYDVTFVSKPENQAAFSDIARTAAGLPRTSCARR